MQLVSIVKGEPRTTTLAIAEGTKIKHKNVMGLVRTYLDDLRDFGPLTFETRNSAFETLNSDARVDRSNQGRPTEYATLNEEQATLLITYMRNGDAVRQFKKGLVKEFYRMKRMLLNKHNLSVIEARQQGKATRRSETDTISQFVQYAISQGSRNASKYYMSITNMTYSNLFYVRAASPQPFRDLLDAMQLTLLATAECVIEAALIEGMKLNMFYKDVYQLARDRVVGLVRQLPPSRLLINHNQGMLFQ